MSILLKEDFITLNTSAWDAKFSTSSNTEVPTEEETTTETPESVEETQVTGTEETPVTDETTPKEGAKEEEQAEEKEQTEEDSKQEAVDESYPKAGEFLKWGEWLKNKLEENAKLSDGVKQKETDIIKGFFNSFFVTNWDSVCGEKLKTFETLKQLFIKDNGQVRIDAFNTNKNAFLIFLTSNFVKELLTSGKLTEDKFNKLLYAFVDGSKKVSSTEFRRGPEPEEYNLIYCPLFYELDSATMDKYLTAQAKVLRITGSSYSDSIKNLNKKAFLATKNKDVVEAATDAERAKIIKNYEGIYPDITDMSTATKLNNLDLANAVIGAKETKKASDNPSTETGTSEKLSDSELSEIDAVFKSWAENPDQKLELDQTDIDKLKADNEARAELMNKLLARLQAR